MVVEDDPANLKRQMLSRRQFEVQLDKSVSDVDIKLDSLIDIELVHNRVIRYSTDDPVKANPQLVRHLDSLGLGVISLVEQSATLEDVYLSIVNGQTG